MDDPQPTELGFQSPDQYQAAREALLAAEFTPAGIASALGRENLLAVAESDLPGYLYQTQSENPRDTLIRLFLLEQPVEQSAVRDALSSNSLESWSEAGVLARDGETIRSLVKLLPYGSHYFAADLAGEIRRGGRNDFVMSVGHATELLAYMAIPSDGGTALDIGSGCGALGILAAGASQEVLASDIAPRSVAFTQFNARLNGVSNLQAIEGDMFAPAKDRTFDRMLCNPPFVISPGGRYIFRDSGRRGDEFCRELARAAPPMLADGGYFQLIANCPHIAGRDWKADWHSWFDDLGCDVIVWANQTSDVAEYAATWIRDTETVDLVEQAERFDQWMRYYEAERIEAITYGVITMRKRSGDNFVAIDDTQRRIVGPCGEQVRQAFELASYFNQFSAEADLLDQAFTPAANVWLAELRLLGSDAVTPHPDTEIRLRGGIEIETDLDRASVAVVEHCRSGKTLREIVPSIAARFGIAEETLAKAVPSIVVQLATRGYLLPLR